MVEAYQSNGKVMGATNLMIIIKFCMVLFFLAGMHQIECRFPNLKPTCDHLELTPCDIITSKDKDGKHDFRYYYEQCSYHTCTTISPRKPPPPPPGDSRVYWMPPAPPFIPSDPTEEEVSRERAGAYFSKISSYPTEFQVSDSRYQTRSFHSDRKNHQNMSGEVHPPPEPTIKKGKASQTIFEGMSKYWDPSLVGVDSQGRFVRAEVDDFWFCAGGGSPPQRKYQTVDGVDYDARVTTNTPRTLGLTEDLKAHCEFLRFMNLLYLTSCDQILRICSWDCLPAARAFYCAMYFPMCQRAPGNIYGTGINLANNQTQDIVYIPNNLPPDVNINASFVIVKPCRGLCWAVTRGCTANIAWACHLKESRDFADTPSCNSVNYREGYELIQ